MAISPDTFFTTSAFLMLPFFSAVTRHAGYASLNTSWLIIPLNSNYEDFEIENRADLLQSWESQIIKFPDRRLWLVNLPWGRWQNNLFRCRSQCLRQGDNRKKQMIASIPSTKIHFECSRKLNKENISWKIQVSQMWQNSNCHNQQRSTIVLNCKHRTFIYSGGHS